MTGFDISCLDDLAPPRMTGRDDPAREKITPTSDPVDLWGKFAAPALPLGLLPPLLEQHALVQAELMGVDAGGLAAATLAVCAAAIPDAIKLQVKRHDTYWNESARLWVALIGDPSTRKTPVLSAASRPLARLDADLYRQYARALADWSALPKEEQKLTSRPAQTRLRIEDTTIEAAQEILKDSPNGVLCLQDELSGWFGSMDKYNGSKGGQADRGFWLRSFNGGEYVLNRVGRGSVLINNLSVSMLGGIQPDPLRKLAADTHDDGLLQRLFPIIMAPAVQGQDVETPDVAEHYADLIARLHALKPPHGTGQIGAHLPVNLQFDDGAQEVRRGLERKHIELASTECFNKKLASHLGKYDGLFARLCVVWHCVENARAAALPPIITEATARRVAAFLHGFLLRHAVAFYAGVMGLSDDHDRITSVAGYILAHEKGVVSNRDVQRGDSTMRGLERNQIQRIFEQMEALGWLEQAPARRAMDPPIWKVNPAVHSLYAARAKSERTRRLAAREAIAEMVGARG